jgi:hypothetical protein
MAQESSLHAKTRQPTYLLGQGLRGQGSSRATTGCSSAGIRNAVPSSGGHLIRAGLCGDVSARGGMKYTRKS